jgi:hypothetical protein
LTKALQNYQSIAVVANNPGTVGSSGQVYHDTTADIFSPVPTQERLILLKHHQERSFQMFQLQLSQLQQIFMDVAAESIAIGDKLTALKAYMDLADLYCSMPDMWQQHILMLIMTLPQFLQQFRTTQTMGSLTMQRAKHLLIKLHQQFGCKGELERL